MDRRERYSNQEETLRLAYSAMQARLWTALPGIVESVAGDGQTITVQPTVNGQVRNADGSVSELQMPILTCPVLWVGGGGMTATFPIAQGDECLVIFASRCIDGWWSQGGVQGQRELRMHNLSDGFALVGVRSAPRSFQANQAAARLTSDDGSFYYEMNPSTKVFKVVASGGIELNGVAIDSLGNISGAANIHGSGTITGDTDVVAAGISGKGHTHTSESPGSPTSPPIP